MLTVTTEPDITPHTSHPYPKLMIATNNMIVLFVSSGAGTVIKPSGGNDCCILGESGVRWSMDDFADYEGTITLTQNL